MAAAEEKTDTLSTPYNSRIIDIYLTLIRKNYPFIDIDELLEYADMKLYQVEDQGHWFNQEQVDRFYEKLVALSGNENIAREAGQFSASMQDANLLSRYFLAMVGPTFAYELIGKASANFARSSVYTIRKLSSNSVEVISKPREEIQEKPYQCENRTGFLEAISIFFNKKPPRIEHPECLFRGDNQCRYIISWDNSLGIILKKIRNYLIPVLIATVITGFFLLPIIPAILTASTEVFLLLAFSYFSKHKECQELANHMREDHSTTEELIQQINLNYNNTLITNEIGQVINQFTTIDGILESVIHISEKRLDFDRGMILLANGDKTRLEYRKGFGYLKPHLELLQDMAFHLDNPDSKGIFVVSFREKRPFLINSFEDIKNDLSPRSYEFAKRIGSRSFICCPILCDNEPLGIFAVDNLHSQRPLVQSDMSLLMGIASVIGIAVKNAQLLEAREQQFQSILRVLASSIDARDPLTSGHSEKVTQYAVGICREMNLPREYHEMIRIAALLHDYGKIGVPDNILKKNGKLTAEEFEIIKTHARKTRDILEQINFDGLYSLIPEIAGSHHEKFDGSGYPHGLKGPEIPLGARIIAVADFYEAITSRRHYRLPMTKKNAVETLLHARENHLDSKIVDAFLRYLENNGI